MFGLALIIGTYIPAVHKLLVSKIGAAIVGLMVIALLVMAFIA
jgi:hypothetical protein